MRVGSNDPNYHAKGVNPRDIYTSHSDRAERARQATDALCKGCNQKGSQTSN